MKKIIIILTTVFMSIFSFSPVLAFDKSENNEIYISYIELTQYEKIELFSRGYKKIFTYNNDNTRSLGTYTLDECTLMKKRGYGWIGYSKSCFHETYTAVNLTFGSTDVSVSIGNISVSFPVSNAIAVSSGTIALTPSEMAKIDAGTHYSCIRYKGYLTYCKYSAKIYDRATNVLINQFTYDHTYTFKNNKASGFDYYLEVRTPSKLNEIKKNKYIGTNEEKKNIDNVSWVNISNPNDASLLP